MYYWRLQGSNYQGGVSLVHPALNSRSASSERASQSFSWFSIILSWSSTTLPGSGRQAPRWTNQFFFSFSEGLRSATVLTVSGIESIECMEVISLSKQMENCWTLPARSGGPSGSGAITWLTSCITAANPEAFMVGLSFTLSLSSLTVEVTSIKCCGRCMGYQRFFLIFLFWPIIQVTSAIFLFH